MDFQALIVQINELEENNRNEKAKYLEEVARHESTKKDLSKVQQELAALRDTQATLQEKLAAADIREQGDQKTIVQLKKTVKEMKEENGLLKDSVDKEVKLMKEKRAWFTSQMDAINERLRSHLRGKAAANGFLPPSPSEQEGAAVDTDNNKMEVCSEGAAPNQVIDTACKEEELRVAREEAQKLAQEVAKLKEVEARHSETVVRLEGELKQLTGEFQQLDAFATSAAEALQRLSTCPSCGHSLAAAMQNAPSA